MKTQRHLLTTFTFLIAGVWLVFGLYCKVLNQVPRHEEIVAQILGTEQAVDSFPFSALYSKAPSFWR